MIRVPPRSPLFPSTTLFRSTATARGQDAPAPPRIQAVELSGAADPADRLRAYIDSIAAPGAFFVEAGDADRVDRKSTRLNSSHANISDAGFCLKKKKKYALL